MTPIRQKGRNSIPETVIVYHRQQEGSKEHMIDLLCSTAGQLYSTYWVFCFLIPGPSFSPL
jgi:hypothetical protein